jgi:hypothetical protein
LATNSEVRKRSSRSRKTLSVRASALGEGVDGAEGIGAEEGAGAETLGAEGAGVAFFSP